MDIVNLNQEIKEDFLKLDSLLYLTKINECEIKSASILMGLENLNLISMEGIGSTIVDFIRSIYEKIKSFLKSILDFFFGSPKNPFTIKMQWKNNKTGEIFETYEEAVKSTLHPFIREHGDSQITNFMPLDILNHRVEFFDKFNNILIDQIKFVMSNIEEVRADSKDAVDLLFHSINENKLKTIGCSINHQNHLHLDTPSKFMSNESNVMKFQALLDKFEDYRSVENKIISASKPLQDSSFSTIKLLASIEKEIPTKEHGVVILPEQKERLDMLANVLKTIQTYSFNIAVLVKSCAADKEACYKTGMSIVNSVEKNALQPPLKKVA